MNLHTYPSKDLALEAATFLNKHLSDIITKPVLLLISGGSSLSILTHLKVPSHPALLTLSVFDDRFTTDPSQNNFCLLSETSFFKKAVKQGATYISTKVEVNETVEEHGARFERDLQKWRADNPAGVVLATMGVGPDGHTGGMMPFPENPTLFTELFESEAWATGYNAGTKNPFSERITVTMTFIKAFVTYAVVYISGENKKISLKKIKSESGSLADAPCRIIRSIPQIDICTDVTTE